MGRFPNFAVLAFVLCLASIGLPGLNNFVSEMLMLAGLFDARNPRRSPAGAGGRRGGRHLPQRVVHADDAAAGVLRPAEGAGRRSAPKPPTDLTRREFVAFGTLAGAVPAARPVPAAGARHDEARTCEQLATSATTARARVTGRVRSPPEPRARGAAAGDRSRAAKGGGAEGRHAEGCGQGQGEDRRGRLIPHRGDAS